VIRIVIVAIFLAFGTSAYCQMYKWVDKDGKVRYSDQPPPQDAKQKGVLANPSLASPPSGETKGRTGVAQSGNSKGPVTQESFRPEEQTALKTICAIYYREKKECREELQRLCPLEELVAGIGGNAKKGLKVDPRLDPNYEYRMELRGTELSISAIPRKPGLSGLYMDEDSARFNPTGPARASDQKITGSLNCIGISK